MKKIKRRHPLTLLEVVIALSLTGILLSFLWQSYFSCQKQLIKGQALKEAYLKKMLLYQKICYLMDHIDTEKMTPIRTMKIKAISNQALVIHANLPVDLDKDFSSSSPVVLYLGDDKILYLATAGKRGKLRSEPLIEEVEIYDVTFFNTKKKCWQSHWDSEKQTLPAMIQIKLSSSLLKETFYFFPSQNIQAIEIDKEI